MRIKSAENGGHATAYLSRDPKDPLPNPHEGTRYRNGSLKETDLITESSDKKLDSRSGITEENNNTIETHFVNGQNHVVHPTVIRNDHEMAVRTKVISVKRNIQPSNNNYRAKSPQTPSNSLHGTNRQTPTTNGQTTPKMESQQKFQFNYNDMPPKSPRTPNGAPPPSTLFATPRTPGAYSPSTPSAVPKTPNGRTPTTPYTPTTPHDPFSSFDVTGSRRSSSTSGTLPYPVSPPIQSPNYFNASPTRLTRQMSSYERTPSGSYDLDRLSAELTQTNVSNAPKFIKDTSAFWYKPDITRDQALAILREKPPGSFVVRDSRCFPGAFGLALKVDRLPAAVQAKPGVDMSNEYVRHFLIEMSPKGVRLKGCPNEPVFGSLSALVYQHSITPIALPCKLIIPDEDQEIPPDVAQNGHSDAVAAAELLKQGAACQVIYIGSLDTESLTGPKAIENAITKTCAEAKSNPNKTSIVHFKVSPQGITLTDLHRKVFFRRHYPTTSVTFCDLDPQGGGSKKQAGRRWDATTTKGGPDAWMFGFVARKISGTNNNECHIFAELESTQPARAIVNFVSRILIGSHRQGNSP